MIEVDLVGDSPEVLEGILVALDLHHAGRYYYGTLIGLTNSTGRARITRERLERGFAESQQLFVMDYPVPLAQCDLEAVVRVEGGRAFRQGRQAADTPLVAPAARALWRAAANDRVASTSVTFRLDQTTPDGVAHVTLPVRAAHGWLRWRAI